MPREDFDGAAWVGQLAEALASLAQSVTASRINMPLLTNEAYHELAGHAVSHPEARARFESYHPNLESDPTETVEVLRSHPTIESALAESPGHEAVMMTTPTSAFRVELTRLATNLTRAAVRRRSATAAAETLRRYLEMSDSHQLPGYEITLLRGLEVDGKFDLNKGTFIASYDELTSLGLLTDREDAPWDDYTDYRALEAVALVRTLAWGPGVAPAATSKTPPSALRLSDVTTPARGRPRRGFEHSVGSDELRARCADRPLPRG